ncbi:hypothetical protein HYU07_02345 [Candidatus Woesearchaeota archaeon]|nr:hypothetical protein [Candidatus Woesearchaeota archaeon]
MKEKLIEVIKRENLEEIELPTGPNEKVYIADEKTINKLSSAGLIDDKNYSLLQIKIENVESKSYLILPKKVYYFMRMPGETSGSDALDELLETHQDVISLEARLGSAKSDSKIMLTLADAGQQVKHSYETQLINNIVSSGELDDRKLAEYGLKDPEIKKRVDFVIAKITGKTAQELKDTPLSKVLIHKTIAVDREMTVSRNKRIRCYVGSHFEWRDKVVDEKARRQVPIDLYFTPETQNMLDEAVEIAKSKGYTKGAGVHSITNYRNLLATQINLEVAKVSPEKTLPIETPAKGGERYER